MQKYGYLIDEEKTDDRDLLYSDTQDHIEVDYVDYEKDIQPALSQYSRGSCVSFGCTAMIEWLMNKKFKKWNWFKYIDLSEEMLYQQIAWAGGGATIRDAMRVLQKIGTCREEHWEYNKTAEDIDTRYLIDWHEHRRALGDAKKFRGLEYARLTTPEEMRTAIAKQPFVVGLRWSQEWSNPKDTIQGMPLLKPAKTDGTGHLIAMFGFKKIGDKNYYKIRNSHSRRWGLRGYAWIEEETLFAHEARAWILYAK